MIDFCDLYLSKYRLKEIFVSKDNKSASFKFYLTTLQFYCSVIRNKDVKGKHVSNKKRNKVSVDKISVNDGFVAETAEEIASPANLLNILSTTPSVVESLKAMATLFHDMSQFPHFLCVHLPISIKKLQRKHTFAQK